MSAMTHMRPIFLILLAYLYELVNDGLEVLDTSEHERVDTQAALIPSDLISICPGLQVSIYEHTGNFHLVSHSFA